METPTKPVEPTLPLDSSEKKKQKKREQKERKKIRDRALQEEGIRTPIKETEENTKEVEEVNQDVENAAMSHLLAKSSKKSMMDHFKSVDSPIPRATERRKTNARFGYNK